ncbi:MAG: hydroxyacid dehydrogenase [Rhodobacteraceae bacterium]|nr:MAG: hydroxyacid dehydrogenase [Paracoccaceae bacterium]
MTLNPLTADLINDLKIQLSKDVLGEVSAGYLEDPRGNYTGTAACLARPRTLQDASTILQFCNTHKIAVIPYGGGTGLVRGQVGDMDPAPLILSVERLNDIGDVDTANATLTVGAGAILADIQAVADKAGMVFPLSLASEGSCRIGGNLATNAGGVQVLRYGNTRDLCLGVQAILPDGEVFHDLKGLRKDNTGYDLRNLLIGSEGSLALITAATLKLFPKPVEQATAVATIESPAQGVELLKTVQAQLSGLVSSFELIHGTGLEFLRETLPDIRLPFAQAPQWMVLIEVAGGQGSNLDTRLFDVLGQAVEDALIDDVLVAQNLQQRGEFWNMREHIPLANRNIGAVYSHDISVPISSISAFIDAGIQAIADLGDMRVNCFGHLGDGNLHFNVFPAQGRDRSDYSDLRLTVKKTVHDLVHSFGGSVSAEHGIGRLKTDDLETYGDATGLKMMRVIKGALDPNGIMNPQVIIKG